MSGAPAPKWYPQPNELGALDHFVPKKQPAPRCLSMFPFFFFWGGGVSKKTEIPFLGPGPFDRYPIPKWGVWCRSRCWAPLKPATCCAGALGNDFARLGVGNEPVLGIPEERKPWQMSIAFLGSGLIRFWEGYAGGLRENSWKGWVREASRQDCGFAEWLRRASRMLPQTSLTHVLSCS